MIYAILWARGKVAEERLGIYQMNNTILPYGLFLFIALFIYYGAYAIPYEKKHKPPEETSRWIFWVDVVLVKGILVILIIAFPEIGRAHV